MEDGERTHFSTFVNAENWQGYVGGVLSSKACLCCPDRRLDGGLRAHLHWADILLDGSHTVELVLTLVRLHAVTASSPRPHLLVASACMMVQQNDSVPILGPNGRSFKSHHLSKEHT